MSSITTVYVGIPMLRGRPAKPDSGSINYKLPAISLPTNYSQSRSHVGVKFLNECSVYNKSTQCACQTSLENVDEKGGLVKVRINSGDENRWTEFSVTWHYSKRWFFTNRNKVKLKITDESHVTYDLMTNTLRSRSTIYEARTANGLGVVVLDLNKGEDQTDTHLLQLAFSQIKKDIADYEIHKILTK